MTPTPSAYDNDPRVAVHPDGVFMVDTGGGVRCVCPGHFDGYVTHTPHVDDAEGMGFDTADEAIHSLIGEPR